MATLYVLGPAIESVIEPDLAAPVPTVGRVGIKFHPTKPTEPGGRVNVQLADPVSSSDKRPVAIHAFFTSPPSKVPALDARTPEWFFSSGSPKTQVAVPQPPIPVTDLQCVVPGVQPGVHHVQTVLEYS